MEQETAKAQGETRTVKQASQMLPHRFYIISKYQKYSQKQTTGEKKTHASPEDKWKVNKHGTKQHPPKKIPKAKQPHMKG